MLYLHLIGRQVRTIATHLFTILKIVISFIKSHKLLSALVAVLIIGGLIALYYFLPKADVAEVSSARTVTLIQSGSAAGGAPLSVIGTVRSAREALVSPDSSGTVQAVYRSLGEFVSAGAIIAELKNDSQEAGVAQARAALQKTESAVAVGGIGVGTAESGYQSAQETARATLLQTYASVSDAVERRIDQMFTNPGGTQPKLVVTSSNSQLVSDSEAGRLAMQSILTRQATAQPNALGVDALIAELERVQKELGTVQSFAQNVVQALNGALSSASVSESEIALYRGDAAAALATVNGLTATVSGTIENLKARRAAVEIAETSLSNDTTGKSADIASAEANLAAALANLERTLIRAPISGTINRLDVEVGSFVNASQPVVYITSAGGLEAVAFISGTDLKDVRTGARVRVGGVADGTLVRAATALDPITKKAEIRVALPPSSSLIAGQSATLEIARAPKTTVTTTVTIPLSAPKITPEGPLVFTVSDESLLVANPVTLGTVRGSYVDVESGLTPETMIVEDARGLKEGQVVVVKL